MSVYSDDHGETWRAGEPVGTGMDENKTVELSDGRVMLNSRDSARSGYRKVAISTDGGVTYGPVSLDEELPDPANNASIVRAFPNAEQGSDEAKVLLFSNAASQTARSNGTVRMSCDDGESWPVSRVFQPAGMAYSTLATLPDGSVGLLYEPNSGNGGIRFAKFNLAWLGGLCAGIDVADARGPAGASTDVSVTVTSQTGTDLDGDVSIEVPGDWPAVDPVPVTVPADDSATVTVPVEVPAAAYAGDYPITVALNTEQRSASAQSTFTVEAAEDDLVTIVPTLRTSQEDYVRGDVLRYDYRVTNLTDETIALVPSSEDLEGFNRPAAPNCGYGTLPAGESYTCSTAFHTITEADLAAGEFTPSTSWAVHAGGYSGEVLETLDREGPTAELTTLAGLIPQSELSVHAVSSAQSGTPGDYALDGDAGTHWHTDWELTEGPHWITLDLGAEYDVNTVRYLGRQSGGQNGMLREYNVYVSADPEAWGEPVASGELEAGTSPELLEVDPTIGRYVTIEYLSSWSDGGRHFASAAEFNVVGQPVTVIDSVSPVGDVQVEYGTSLEDAVATLPSNTTVTDDAGATHEVDLTWTIEGYDGEQEGDYVATGAFELPQGVAQAEPAVALEVTATITVLPADEPGEGDSDGQEPGDSDADGQEPGDSDADGQQPGDSDTDDQQPGGDDATGQEPGGDDADAGQATNGDDGAGAGSDAPSPGTDDPAERLPVTGAQVSALVLGAMLLLGAGAVILTRRRATEG